MKATINDTTIYYETHGTGEPLVLIAGLTAHSQTWPNQLELFTSKFKTIVLDNRNSGRSSIDDVNYSIKTMADDVKALLDHLQITSAHILGRSMGGAIAQEMAINHPSYVNKLVLTATTPVFSARDNLLFEHLLHLKESNFDQRLLYKEFIFWENSPFWVNDAQKLEECIDACLSDPYLQSYEGFKNQIKAIREFNALDRLEKIKAPTAVISGNQDILVTPKESEILVEKIETCQWNCLPNAGHSVQNDAAELYNKIVLDFLL